MYRVAVPEVERLEARKLAQRALYAPCAALPDSFLDLADLFHHQRERALRERFSGNIKHCRRGTEVVLRAYVVDRLKPRDPVLHDLADLDVLLLDKQALGDLQLREVQQRVGIAREHAGAGSLVHAALAGLIALGMMVAVDDGAAELVAHLVKLIAEARHLLGAVLVAGEHLVDRVDDHGDKALFGSAADQHRRELVHRYRPTAQVPDINASDVVGRLTERLVHVDKAVITACLVKFQVDIHHLALRAVPTEPRLAFRDGDRQLDQSEGLAGF